MDLREPTAGIAYIYNCRRQHSSLKQNMNESPKQLRKSRQTLPFPSELRKCDLQGPILPPLDLRQFFEVRVEDKKKLQARKQKKPSLLPCMGKKLVDIQLFSTLLCKLS